MWSNKQHIHLAIYLIRTIPGWSACLCFCVAAFRGVLSNPTKAVRDTLVNQCAQILACYRKNCASPSSAGQVLKTTCQRFLRLNKKENKYILPKYCWCLSCEKSKVIKLGTHFIISCHVYIPLFVCSSWSSQSAWSCYRSISTACWRATCCCREPTSHWTTGLTYVSWSAAWTSRRATSSSTHACCHWWDHTHTHTLNADKLTSGIFSLISVEQVFAALLLRMIIASVLLLLLLLLLVLFSQTWINLHNQALRTMNQCLFWWRRWFLTLSIATALYHCV